MTMGTKSQVVRFTAGLVLAFLLMGHAPDSGRQVVIQLDDKGVVSLWYARIDGAKAGLLGVSGLGATAAQELAGRIVNKAQYGVTLRCADAEGGMLPAQVRILERKPQLLSVLGLSEIPARQDRCSLEISVPKSQDGLKIRVHVQGRWHAEDPKTRARKSWVIELAPGRRWQMAFTKS